MAKPKRLTLVEMDKLDKQFDEKKKVLLAGKYEEEIDIKFRKSKIDLLIANYLKIMEDLKQKDGVDAETIIDSVSLINALTVKYFTTIQIPELNKVENLISVSKVLYNIGVLDELFEDGENSFPKDQIEFLTDEINKTTKRIGEQYNKIMAKIALNNESIEGELIGGSQES